MVFSLKVGDARSNGVSYIFKCLFHTEMNCKIFYCLIYCRTNNFRGHIFCELMKNHTCKLKTQKITVCIIKMVEDVFENMLHILETSKNRVSAKITCH